MNSLEEVDAIMAEFPFGPFSDVVVYPLVGLESSLKNAKQAIQAMAPPDR